MHAFGATAAMGAIRATLAEGGGHRLAQVVKVVKLV